MTQTLYLVRHAQSEANADHLVLQTKTNVGVSLTKQGLLQAEETAQFLAAQLRNSTRPFIVWNSPYERTRKTAESIVSGLSQSCSGRFITKESIYLTERQFGLRDDALDYENTHGPELRHFMLHQDEGKEFFARPPLGESPFDVCLRVDFFIKTQLQQKYAEYDHVLVSHGAAVRSMIMMLKDMTYEEYTAMPNPANCSVSIVTDDALLFQEFVPTAVRK